MHIWEMSSGSSPAAPTGPTRSCTAAQRLPAWPLGLKAGAGQGPSLRGREPVPLPRGLGVSRNQKTWPQLSRAARERASGQAAALPAEPEGELRAGTVGAGGEREGIGVHKDEGRLTVNSKENLPSNDGNLSSSKATPLCPLWSGLPACLAPARRALTALVLALLLGVSFAAGSCAGAGVTLHRGGPGGRWPEQA